VRKRRRYGLFAWDGQRWKAVSSLTLPLEQARTFWQNRLLTRALCGGPEMRLRPVEGGSNTREEREEGPGEE